MDYFDLDFQTLEERYIASGGLKKGELAVIGCYTPNRQGKSWIEKAIQEQLAAEFSTPRRLRRAELTKNQLTYCGYIIDDFKAWIPRTKLLQSKGKYPRMVRVSIKQ